PPSPEHHHRDIQGGTARAAVFGVNDGLVSNVALVLGVAGASPGPGFVRLAGLVGLIGGAVSMAAGEYVSMRAQAELLERELEIERVELHRNPLHETRELAQLYRSRGMDEDQASSLAEHLMSDPELALQTHAREELGIDPDELGSPWGAAASSFVAFSLGAVVPLAPWFFADGAGAVVASVVLTVIAALVVGAALAHFTGRSKVHSSLRQAGIAAFAASVTWVLGNLVGVGALAG
ncbi:MAG: VIT1/CCC1 transporter family protein, partial [Acidimicrobiales bacterium]